MDCDDSQSVNRLLSLNCIFTKGSVRFVLEGGGGNRKRKQDLLQSSWDGRKEKKKCVQYQPSLTAAAA